MFHAYMNPPGKWNRTNLKILLDHARTNHLEVATWINPDSQLILFAINDPARGENAGLELYEKMKDQIKSFGLACSEEFFLLGVPIDPQTDDCNIYSRIYGPYPPLTD